MAQIPIRCEHYDCNLDPVFGFTEGTATRCSNHKTSDMVSMCSLSKKAKAPTERRGIYLNVEAVLTRGDSNSQKM